jgi:hypothetical protein
MINSPVLRKWSADVRRCAQDWMLSSVRLFRGTPVMRLPSVTCIGVAVGWHFIHGRDIQKALAKANDHPTGSSDHSSKFPDWPT